MLRSQWDKPDQRLNLGFLRHDNRLVVDVRECKIAEPILNEQLDKLREQPLPKGGTKVILRIAPEGWSVPPDSFFQNNFSLLPALVETVRGRLRESGARFLVDAYCGVGFFSIELADLVDQYVGIEFDDPAVRAARKNASDRQRTNGKFLRGRTERLLSPVLRELSASSTAVILDPPRTGCPPDVLDTLRRYRPVQIIYVSCHPATLARDLNALTGDQVYRLVRVIPLDMFPQTQHVECVADLRLNSQGSVELG
jgi:tRNA/tmRNA/rRNA uracil-C5-methylase (TrmA/RlmC/RlmD family)